CLAPQCGTRVFLQRVPADRVVPALELRRVGVLRWRASLQLPAPGESDGTADRQARHLLPRVVQVQDREVRHVRGREVLDAEGQQTDRGRAAEAHPRRRQRGQGLRLARPHPGAPEADQMTASRFRFPALLLALALGACAGPARERVDGWSGVGSGETVVVGRIELVPPLRKGEQRIDALNSGSFENLVYLIADDKNRTLQDE